MAEIRPPAPGGDDEFPDEHAEQGRRRELESLLFGATVAKDPEQGSIVRGVIVQVGTDEVFVDVGSKSEAVIPREELLDEQGNLEAQPGQAIEATVVSTGDVIRLSRRMLKSARSRAELLDAHRTGMAVEGRVESVRKGGFEVSLAGNTRAFCPLSQIDERKVEEPAAWIGRTLEFRILEMDPKGRNVVVSRRKLLEEQAARRAEEARSRIIEGAVVKGRVVSLQGYGAFVDVGGLQGLLHVSEISHTRLSHPSEALKPGDEITVKVTKVDPSTGKVSLSMKELADDPWHSVLERVRPGERLEGRVARVAEFGAFVELAPGIEGLVHVSELAPGKRAQDARKLIEPGGQLLVKVLDVDPVARRISLARVEQGEEEQNVEPGALVKGKVDRIESFGLLVRLGPGQTGLIPNEEMGTSRGTDHRRDFPPGTEILAEVLAVEEGGRRIRLSRMRALARAEHEDLERFQSGRGASKFSTLGDAFRKGFKRNNDD